MRSSSRAAAFSDFWSVANPDIISIFEFCPASGDAPGIMVGSFHIAENHESSAIEDRLCGTR
jgi:hypothetical protein